MDKVVIETLPCGLQVFEGDDARFKPDYSPLQVIVMGAFGGTYFTLQPERAPAEIRALGESLWRAETYDVDTNYHGVKCSMSYREWLKRGWITDEDPLGWFDWYCQYYHGRRIPAVDRFQINRWYGVAGPFGRHRGFLRGVIQRGSDPSKLLQVLLHWASKG